MRDDAEILAVNKPGDVVCHPSKDGPWSSLSGAVRAFRGEGAAHLVFRLDRETSGLVIFAKSPAPDLAIAWMALSAHARNRFRSNTPLAIDDSTWKRGRGWALSLALAYLAHELDHPGMAGIGVSPLREVSGSDG